MALGERGEADLGGEAGLAALFALGLAFGVLCAGERKEEEEWVEAFGWLPRPGVRGALAGVLICAGGWGLELWCWVWVGRRLVCAVAAAELSLSD